MANAAFNKKKNFSSANWTCKFKNKLVKYCTWSIVLHGAENGHFGKEIKNTWKLMKRGARIWR
jgi:hypothetical protein